MILAHNYQVPEVQDVADFVGDSLGLSRKAAATDADVIAFCGVHFMAETASILSPDKTVLLPDLDAGCSLADSITADQLRAWKAKHPGAIVVMYVNTTAEVKAETDYCCTSSNAVQVVEHICASTATTPRSCSAPTCGWAPTSSGSPAGACTSGTASATCTRASGPADISDVRDAHPDAEFMIHPECGCTTQVMEYVAAGDVDPERTHMLSTGGMLDFARELGGRHVHRGHRDRHAAPARQGEPRQGVHPGQPRGGLPLHEDDHAAEAARRAARPEAAGAGCDPSSPSEPGCRSSAWSRSRRRRRRLQEAGDRAQAAVVGDGAEVDAGGDRRAPSGPYSCQAKRTRSLWASGPNGELEAVAGELLLGGARSSPRCRRGPPPDMSGSR